MSFAHGRNFRMILRPIVFGVGSGESADRRLEYLACDWQAPETQGRRRSVEAALHRLHPLMKPISLENAVETTDFTDRHR